MFCPPKSQLTLEKGLLLGTCSSTHDGGEHRLDFSLHSFSLFGCFLCGVQFLYHWTLFYSMLTVNCIVPPLYRLYSTTTKINTLKYLSFTWATFFFGFLVTFKKMHNFTLYPGDSIFNICFEYKNLWLDAAKSNHVILIIRNHQVTPEPGKFAFKSTTISVYSQIYFGICCTYDWSCFFSFSLFQQ